MKLFAAELDFRAIAREFELPDHFPEEVEAEAALVSDRVASNPHDYAMGSTVQRTQTDSTSIPRGARASTTNSHSTTTNPHCTTTNPHSATTNPHTATTSQQFTNTTNQRVDLREVEFVTIDPAGSMDLDQAVNIAEASVDGAPGWRVLYAIADVAAFVEPGGVVDAESLKRGQTIYLPDGHVRLHPAELSEGSASLLPDQDRPAAVWDMHVRQDGEVANFSVYRALVRSRARFDYVEVERDRVNGTLHPAIRHLPAVGQARQQSDLRREAINLRLPSVSVEKDSGGDYHLVIEPRELMNDYNSELSLMAGMCAGKLMMEAGIGLLRTLPPASPKDVSKFDAAAAALGFFRGDKGLGELLAEIDASTPQGMALMRDAQSLLRGASYVAFGFGSGEAAGGVDQRERPGDKVEPAVHAGVGGFYAHVTAPLRRLADRYATEVCLAIQGGSDVPKWVTAGIERVVDTMKSSTPRANQVDRACLRLTEAMVLQPWVGQNFSAAVMHTGAEEADVFVAEPPVIADCVGTPEEGTTALVTLVKADTQERKVEFAWPAD